MSSSASGTASKKDGRRSPSSMGRRSFRTLGSILLVVPLPHGSQKTLAIISSEEGSPLGRYSFTLSPNASSWHTQAYVFQRTSRSKPTTLSMIWRSSPPSSENINSLHPLIVGVLSGMRSTIQLTILFLEEN